LEKTPGWKKNEDRCPGNTGERTCFITFPKKVSTTSWMTQYFFTEASTMSWVAQYFFYGSNRPPQVKQYFLQKPRLCRE
jgi:hypothetical protein